MTGSYDMAMFTMFGVIIGFAIALISFEVGAMYKRVRKETTDTGDPK